MRVGTAARVLDLPTLTVRNWTRNGRLPCIQAEEGANRYVSAEALAHFAHRLGIIPRWEEALC
jgi:excisionase family DNA binding protein